MITTKLYGSGYSYEGSFGTGSKNVQLDVVTDLDVSQVSSISASEYNSHIVVNGIPMVAGEGYAPSDDEFNYPEWTTFHPLPMSNAVEMKSKSRGALIRDTNGDLYVVGKNTFGQLGDPLLYTTDVPVKVDGISNVSALCAGEMMSHVITSDGLVYGCGRNSMGTVGVNYPDEVPTWTLVTGLSGIVSGDSYEHALFVKDDGTVWGFGANSANQLGRADVHKATSPFQVTGISNAVKVAVGLLHSAVLLSDGTVMVSGSNSQGQIGLGIEVDFRQDFFTPIPGVTGIKDIYAGMWSTFLVKEDGTVLFMGENVHNVFGTGADEDLKFRTPTLHPLLSDVMAIANTEHYSLYIVEEETPDPGVYIKVNGTYVPASNMYIKINDIWV